MNCNCNNINNTDGSGLTAYISHVYGNVLRLAIPLTLRTVTMENGEMVATDTDFIPSSDYPVTVVFSKGGVKISLEATMQNGNIAYIEDLGTIPVGKYDIAVLCKDDNGNPYRFKQVTALHIVDATADANIPSDIEYEVTTWYLDAAIFLALKGEDGVGIDDIITESSGEIGGMNTVTIVLTNGETRTFTVMNGSGQVDSDFNINSPHPLSNSTITAKFNAIDSSIEGLFGNVDYDSQSKTIRFYNKDRSRVLATLDARPFIKDGMVNSVYISNNTLVITFNTDAGREAIGVSLSSIFNPNNYYTKTQVNNLLGNYYNKDVIDNLVRNNASLLDDGRLGNLQSSPIVLDGMYWDNDEWPDGAAGDYYKVYHTVSRDKHEIVLYKWINDGTTIRQVRVYRDVDPTAIYYDKDSETFYRYDMVEDDFIEIETGSGSSGYEPPVGGIPKSDLSQSVQASLNKADTALQSQEQADWNESDSSDPAYIKNKPTIPDVSGFVTAGDVADAVADLVDSAPATLDTLNELAAALGDDPNFATTMTTALGNKVDKVTGKGLSTEDYTTAEKSKLAGLSNYDDTALQAAVAGKVDKESGKSLMTDAERTKLAGIASGAESNVQADWDQTTTTADDYIKNKPTLATVATSGSYNDLSNKPTLFSGNYNDLTNKPTIPAAQVNADWNASSGVMEILNKPTIPTKVSDLTNDSAFITASEVSGIVAGSADVVITETSDYIDITFLTASVDISPSALALNASEKTKTITVSGSHLKGNIAITVPTGFTASPSSITPTDGAVSGTSVTITYTGADASTASGNITATSGDAAKSIPVTYAQYAGPTIIPASSAAISMKTGAGSSTTATLSVTGVNLEGNITAAIGGTDASKFSVSGSPITQSRGSASGTLTITYSPAAADTGTHSATLTLSSTNATDVTISLGGVISTLTTSVNSLSLSTDQGGSATGTFTVEGANLNEDISIVASGTGFLVSPNTIAHSNGSVASTTVTVTYSPSTAGTHTGEVTIQSSGVSKTVTLQGTVVETPNFTSENNYRLQVNGIYYDVMMSNNAPTTDLRVNNSSYSANAASNSYSGDIVIPSTISGKLDGVATTFTVKDIRTRAFSSCSSLNSVVVPDSVTAIHDYAFYDSSLKRLVIGNGVPGFTIGSTKYNGVIGGSTVLDVADFGTAFMDFGPSTNSVKMSANGKVYMRWTGSRESGGNTYYYAKAEFRPFTNTDGTLPSAAKLYVPSGKVSNYQGSGDWAAMFSQGNILAIDE